MPKSIVFEPGTAIRLSEIPTRVEQEQFNKKLAYRQIKENVQVMAKLANSLYAENTRAILLVLQGMDTAGKDGTIRTVMRGVNPRSCQVVSFKQPSEEELDHDFLWRVHQDVPRKGNIGIFNRSHYEDVLVVRVHRLVPEAVWQKRFELINDFERLLTQCDTTIIKCFLHVSKEEQRKRLQARIDQPRARWKFKMGDLAERKLWSEYQQAYEDAINKCNTRLAPWHIVPADQKWYRNLVVSTLLRKTMERLDPKFPVIEEDFVGLRVE